MSDQQQGLIASQEDSALVNQSTMNEMLQRMLDTIRNDIRSSEGRTRSVVEQLATEVNELKIAKSRPSSPTPQQSKQQATPPPDRWPLNMDISDHASQESQGQTAAGHSTVQPVLQEDKRWRPEEVGYFDGDATKVYAFTDRLTSVATNKFHGVKLIQMNLVTVLQGVAFNWYHYEIKDHIKEAYNTSASINPWCQALIERFGPSHEALMSELESDECHYTRKDAANKKDATAYIQTIMRVAKGLKWSQQDGLMTAYHHFEAGLRRDLNPPTDDLTQFIKQIQLRQADWYQIYSTFGKSRLPDLPRPQQQSRPSQQSYQPRPQYSQQQARPSYPPRPPASAPPPPRVYWADQGDEEDWLYDAPTDSYHVAPTHGPGHTPRRQGNTHDGTSGSEAMVYWTSAGEDHRCSHGGCTHYH